MKKSVILFIMAIMSLAFVPAYANAAPTDPVTSPKTEAENAARAEVLNNRLKEIKEMDKSSLTHSEKKALRKEVRAIKAEMATIGNGVYLSVGAIIIIILLLILLL
jgi:Skp family chaperone for outer membrane proteins